MHNSKNTNKIINILSAVQMTHLHGRTYWHNDRTASIGTSQGYEPAYINQPLYRMFLLSNPWT
jgi:hypothetical protein